MKKEDFLKELKEIIQTDIEISEDTKLSDIQEWDSLAMMSCASFLDENFDIQKTLSDLQKFEKVSDILNLVKDKLE